MAEERQGRYDMMVKIPMVGRSDSLNVSIAGSVVLYELFNQKRNRMRHVVNFGNTQAK